MVAGLAKQFSDDTDITNNHIAFLLNKYRTYLLKQKYNNKAQEVPISNYQTVCAKMAYTEPSSLGNCCGNSCYGPSKDFQILRSENTVTYPLSFSDTKASLIRCAGLFSIKLDADIQNAFDDQDKYNEFLDYLASLFSCEVSDIVYHIGKDSLAVEPSIYETSCEDDAKDIINLIIEKYPEVSQYIESVQTDNPQECNPEAIGSAISNYYGNVNMVPKERFGYVGIGKYSGKFAYGTIGIDGHLYIKAKDTINRYNKAFVTSIFENPDKAYEQSGCTYTDSQGNVVTCPNPENGCDPWDNEFPLEDALQAPLIQLVLKDILGAAYRPADTVNNGRDDLSDTEAYIRRNMKQQYVAQQEPQTIE